MSRAVEIAGRPIGPDHPPYVIAELSGNHGGSFERAMALIDAAKAAGADAVKLQTYTADTLTVDRDDEPFRVRGGLWAGRTLHDLYTEGSTPWEWHERLFERAEGIGITIFSSPFHHAAIDLLDGIGAPAFKIASPEIVDIPLIRDAAGRGKPLVISTGMATSDEVDEAVQAARDVGCDELIVLHCRSSYPAAHDDLNLRTIAYLAERYDAVAGFSDHTAGISAAIAAVAAGAAVIEKHLTLDREDGAIDSQFSAEPDELAALVIGVREAYASLGTIQIGPTASESETRRYRRSLFVMVDVAEGDVLDARAVRSLRPALGLHPRHLPEVLGRRAARPIQRGEALAWDMLLPVADA